MYLSDENYEKLLELSEQVNLLRDICQQAKHIETTGDRLSSQFEAWGDTLTIVLKQLSEVV